MSVLPKSNYLLCGFCRQKASVQRVFTKKCFLLTVGRVYRIKRFTTWSRNSLKDVGLGHPVDLETEATVQQVEELIRADRRITIDSVATALGCSHSLAYSIMHDLLKFRRLCSRWVPRELKDRERMNRLGLSLQYLLRYAHEGDVLSRTITGEESWVHRCQPESKRTSVQWKHPSSPSTTKLEV
jgi:hypothetical protein